jgi:dTDP-4-dehydrorhamnose reductase
MRRNGLATRTLAAALAARGLDLVVISTNEVFDGRPSAGLRGYRTTDAPSPINAYGRSKLAAERYAEAEFEAAAGALGIVRTAWLFGPPGNDFPAKILAAADRARSAGQPLRVVGDEAGSPTYTADLAEGIVELLGENAVAGTHHVVNAGVASRAEWAEEVLRQAGVSVELQVVSASDWARASEPPRWGVLEPTPLPSGEPLRSWQGALADYMPALIRARAVAR